jgi:hypothetical protein
MRLVATVLGFVALFIGCDRAEDVWTRATTMDTAAAYFEYLNMYPDSPHAAEADRRYRLLEWPPIPAPSADVLSGHTGKLVTGGGAQGEGWDNAYTDSTKSEKLDGWGVLYTSGDTMLPVNVFKLSKPEPGYAENQYEVLYYDESRTLIRLVPGEGDRLLMLSEGGFLGPMTNTALFEGARVRYVDRVYVLRADGWYCEGRNVSRF